MAYFIETKGNLDLSEVGRVCLNGLGEFSDRFRKKFEAVYLLPQLTGYKYDGKFYTIGMFKSKFDESGVPHTLGSVSAHRLDSIHLDVKNKRLKDLMHAKDVLPDWNVYFEGARLNESMARELGVKLAKIPNVKEVWHYWGSRRNVEIEPLRRFSLLSNIGA
ncbi:MAG: hypothetical protein Q8L29_01440 [archaeon]|nr:hypothetical protein [archaeon]